MSSFRASSNFKAYDASIPNYLHDRPRKIVEHCMQRFHSSDQFGSGDIKIADDISGQIYQVKSMDKTYQVTMGSEKEFPNCTCEDFRRNFLPCKHFFAILKYTHESWSNLSPLYTESPFINLDVSALEMQKVNVSADLNIPNPQLLGEKGENLNTDDLQESTSKLRRDVVTNLKELQNKAYICSSHNALSKCLSILENANALLSENVEKQDGLPISPQDKLRNLPPRKKYFKKFGKFQRRVGKKAKAMRDASVIGTTITTIDNYLHFVLVGLF